jgi:RNA polymerase sigma factor (sigma-70 family)
MNDQELLNAYATEKSEEAFAALIDRYVRLVYSACWRQLGDHQLAEDATQGVFVLLSQKAGKLSQTRLASWLLTTARYACGGIQRAQQRRLRREKAVAMSKADDALTDAPTDAPELLAMLDAGLLKLREIDREAVVLRYLRAQPLRHVGAALGLSEEAARKRVDRGLEKLRRYFRAQGVESDSATLAAVLTRHSSAAGMSQTIVKSILRTCSAGAGNATVITALAAAARGAMFAASLRAAALAIAAVVVLGSAGWGLWSWLESGVSDQPVMADTQAPAQAPAAAINLSTPMDTMDSLFQALQAMNRPGVYACLTADPNRKPTPIDALISWNLAENRLRRAGAKAFGQVVPELKTGFTVDELGRMMLIAWRLNGDEPKIDGDQALLDFPQFNDAVIAALPPDTGKVVQLWEGQPLRFTRSNNQWKCDLDRSVQLLILTDGKLITGDIEAQWRMEMVNTINDVAEKVENGQITRAHAASDALWGAIHQLEHTHNLTNFFGVTLPADVPAEKALAALTQEPQN